jgi:hypothetical protein
MLAHTYIILRQHGCEICRGWYISLGKVLSTGHVLHLFVGQCDGTFWAGNLVPVLRVDLGLEVAEIAGTTDIRIMLV